MGADPWQMRRPSPPQKPSPTGGRLHGEAVTDEGDFRCGGDEEWVGFAPPGARYFCHQRQKYPKAPFRNYVSKNFLPRFPAQSSPLFATRLRKRGNCRLIDDTLCSCFRYRFAALDSIGGSPASIALPPSRPPLGEGVCPQGRRMRGPSLPLEGKVPSVSEADEVSARRSRDG